MGRRAEKLFATQRLLALRRAHPELFAIGSYQPIEVSGKRGQHLCAFTRDQAGLMLVVVVPRLMYQLCADRNAPDWEDTRIALPRDVVWQDVFTLRRLDFRCHVPAAELLSGFPVAALIGATSNHEA